MKKFLRHYLFIISIFTCASICNLFSEDPEGMDFLDKLLKEIEQMESSEDKKPPTPESHYSGASAPEPFSSSYEKPSPASDDQAIKEEPYKPIVKKDMRTLFLEPEIKEFKRADKGTKLRPTKETVLAFKHYANELNTTSRDIDNKLEINQDLPPKFKETKVRDFRQELETTNSLMDLIKDKGIYYSAFLKTGKDSKSKEKKYGKTDEVPSESINIRKNVLDVLKKLQDLNTMFSTPEEDKETDIELIQQLATHKSKQELPKYKPLATKPKPAAITETQKKSEPIFTDDDDDADTTKSMIPEDK